jgi:glycosyltransferase involved in cell wall biosynthesis
LVAHDAIDESFFEPTETKLEASARLGLPEAEHIVMYIGGLATWKGVYTFCEAATASHTSTFVVIGGSTQEVAEYREKYPAVVFLGQRPYAELRDNQQAADILVIPNSAQTLVSTEYTSPLKLFAHMASQKPLVVSNVPSILRVTGTTEVTVFEADNAVRLAEAIESVKATSTPPVISKVFASRYTWTNRAKAVLDFIF